MKKFILIFLTCLILSGCSLIPRLTFSTPNTVPQSTQQSKAKEICKGKVEWSENGTIISCSKGYFSYAYGYDKQERKMTITERIKSFINSLVGWGFWGLILLVILVPGLAGTLIGRFIEGTIGIAKQTLNATVRAVQRARKNGEDLNIALATEQDTKVKDYIIKIKKEEKIK